MKINWGGGIVIAIALFMAFILYFVITMTIDEKYEYQMVADDYYKQEIGFQLELDSEINAAKSPYKVKMEESKEGLLVIFPEEFASTMENGKVSFYRVSKQMLDFEMPIVLENNSMMIPDSKILPGRWNITINWEVDGKPYSTKRNINY